MKPLRTLKLILGLVGWVLVVVGIMLAALAIYSLGSKLATWIISVGEWIISAVGWLVSVLYNFFNETPVYVPAVAVIVGIAIFYFGMSLIEKTREELVDDLRRRAGEIEKGRESALEHPTEES